LIIGKIYKQKRKIKTIHTRFMMNPILSMDLISIIPLENAIALGGVPIGNIDAQLAAKVIARPN